MHRILSHKELDVYKLAYRLAMVDNLITPATLSPPLPFISSKFLYKKHYRLTQKGVELKEVLLKIEKDKNIRK